MPGKIPALYAFFAAINDYPRPIPRLKGCLNDLSRLKAYLDSFCNDQGMAFHPFVLEDDQATREKIIDGFGHFNEALEGDFCLFFFAGHGSRGEAHEVFHHLKASGMHESLVCYDSRLPGGRDLLDKELSFLIWKASLGRDVHFAVVTDCCHSGSVTRLAEEVRVRQVRKSPQALLAEEFLGFESYTPSADGRYSPPRGRYVHLGASLPFEMAKEIRAKGAPQGAFTACLLEALAGARGCITYAELASRVAVRMRTLVTDQSPQIEATLPADKNLFFLSGAAPLAKGQYLVGHDRARGWIVNAGALHGLATGMGEDRTALRLLEDGHKVFLTEVLPDCSRVEPMEGYDKKKVFPAVALSRARPAVTLAFAPKSEAGGKVLLAPILQDNTSGLFRLSDNATQADYLIHARNQSYFLTSSCGLRPLFQAVRGYSQASAEIFVAHVEAAAAWARLLGLSNPDTTIVDNEIEVKLYRTTQANNYEDSAPAERLSLDTDIEFPYFFDGKAWHYPAFQLKVKNTGTRRLWVSLLYLGDDFSIANRLIPKEPLDPGQETWAKDAHKGRTYLTVPVRMDDAYHSWGLTTISEYFKLFISTDEINTDFFNQEALQQEARAGAKRALARGQELPCNDWGAKDIPLKIYRPLPPAPFDTRRAAKWFGHSFEAPPGFSARLSLNTLEKAAALFPTLPDMETGDGELFRPFDLDPPESLPGLCTIELAGCAGSISTATPLRIRLQASAADIPLIRLFRFGPETGKLSPVNFVVKDNEFRVNELPETTPSVLGKARSSWWGRCILKRRLK